MAGIAQRGWLRGASIALFAGVLALVVTVSDPVQAGAVLFVVPIALLALADGLRGGLTGVAIAVLLTVVWATTEDVGLEALGYASRISAFVVIGVLVGRYEDLARRHVQRTLDERYATELQDRVVQSLVLARYALPRDDDAAEHVEAALDNTRQIISDRLGDVEPGDLRLRMGP